MSRPAVFAAAALAAVWHMACGAGGGPAEEAGSEIAVAERMNLEVRAEAAGLVEPILVVEVKSKATGEVQSLRVETGDVVAKGDLLATIDPRDARTALAQAQADFQAAEARLSNARIQLTRSRELRDAQVITEQEYESALLEATTAEAELVRSRTTLALAQERMGDVTIRAPIDGTIIEKTVEVGQIVASASQNVSGGTTLLKMADLDTMQVRALIDETDIGRIEPGQPATITVEAYPQQTFRGQVLKVEPQAVVEQNVTMFPVLVRLGNEQGLLKPGMNAEVAIDIAMRRNVVVVPNAAIVAPREAASAAAALGLDPDELGMGFGPGGGRPGGGAAGPPSGAPGGEAPGAAGRQSAAGGGTPSAECRELFQRLRAGGGPPGDADRAKLQACREAVAASEGAPRNGAASGESAPAVETRPAIVFVETQNGPEPRRIRIGVNDWDRSEVVSGLEAGERVYLISVARIKQQQQELQERIRQRTGGPVPGGGTTTRRGS